MMKRLTVLLAVLALVAAACGGSSEDTTTDTTAGAGPPAQAGGTLAEVRARGNLNCGVSGGAAGFTTANRDHYCWPPRPFRVKHSHQPRVGQ